MSLDNLRGLSDLFGETLSASLKDLGKEAEVQGGGLRHGDVEWQVTYPYEGLRRFLMFDISEASGALVLVSARAAATDESGRWASAVAGSTSLPREFLLDRLKVVVPELLSQARFVANSLGPNDMRAMVLGSFGTART